MTTRAIQDYYPDNYSHCYGCGRLNEHGLQIKSYEVGDETVATFRPQPFHLAIPGYVYGGLIASLIDCHGTGTAAAAAQRAAGRELDSEPIARFVTASLHVNYRRPTPIDAELELRGRVREQSSRKVIVDVTLSANGQLCADGEVIAVRIPDDYPGKSIATDERR